MMPQVLAVTRFQIWIEAIIALPKMSQATVARLTKYDRGTIARHRKGESEPNISTIRAMASSVGVDPEEVQSFLDGKSDTVPLPSDKRKSAISINSDVFTKVSELAKIEGITPEAWIRRMADESYHKLDASKKRKGA